MGVCWAGGASGGGREHRAQIGEIQGSVGDCEGRLRGCSCQRHQLSGMSRHLNPRTQEHVGEASDGEARRGNGEGEPECDTRRLQRNRASRAGGLGGRGYSREEAQPSPELRKVSQRRETGDRQAGWGRRRSSSRLSSVEAKSTPQVRYQRSNLSGDGLAGIDRGARSERLEDVKGAGVA